VLRVEPLDGAVSAANAALLVAGDERPFALVGDWAGSRAVLGSCPMRMAEGFEALDDLPDVEGSGMGGGWFGWLGYGLGVEPRPPGPPRPVPLPRSALAFYDHVLRLDLDGQWWFEALWTPERDAALRERRDVLAARLASPPVRRPVSLGEFRASGGHRDAVAECRERIAGGEVFQANICMRLESEWDGDAAQLFCRLAEQLEPQRGAYVAGPWGAVVSMSPELFLRREPNWQRSVPPLGTNVCQLADVWSEPIKGTARRGSNAADDEAQRAALAASEKDRAENVMIVDLMRNDLGRVSEYGSVHVDALAETRPGPGVWHLVSRVSGTLRPDVGNAELLRATFPPGSVTGAPKVQTLRVIHELESSGREVYTGAIGYASPLAGLELSVAIRTFELAAGSIWLGAGGGITWSSDPDRELDECLAKAAPLIAAVDGRIEQPPRGEARGIPRALNGGADRPDPALGVFETVLVVDGEPQHLEDHLRRLGLEAVPSFPELHGAQRLRLKLAPDGSLTWDTASLPPDPPADGFLLSAWLLPGGLGERKWLDRRLLDHLTASAPGVPLLVDGDGSVLEASWGNVWAIEGERLVTPPADGRILPGITRARLLRLAPELGLEAVEENLSLERLRDAEGAFLTSALRGAVPAHVAGGAPPHPLVVALADALGMPSRAPARAGN
jgi:para-aminobenzoate synthetase/4-amino-4-deoxychorismate lyase